MTIGSLLHNPFEDFAEPAGSYAAQDVDVDDDDFRQYVDDMILKDVRAIAKERELIDAVAESFNQDTYADCKDNVLIMNDMYALGIEPCQEEPTSREYVDNVVAGDIVYDTEADQVLISDGEGWLTFAPTQTVEPIDIGNDDGKMVITANGLSVRTADGDIDLLAKIHELEELVYKLTGTKRDEPTQVSADDPDAFKRAMKGI